MKRTVFPLLTALLACTAQAQDSQTAYNFLRLPVSAHSAALGGDNITIIEDDPTLVFNNPALLSSVSDKSINLNFMTYMEGAKTASASFCKIVAEKATVAVTAQYMDYGNMKQADEDNVLTGEFSAKDIAVSGVFSYMLGDRIAGGITAKVINSYIGDYSSWAVGVDLGLNYYDPEREWSLSLVAKNLGGQAKAYDNRYEKMPLDVQPGCQQALRRAAFQALGHARRPERLGHSAGKPPRCRRGHHPLATGLRGRRLQLQARRRDEDAERHRRRKPHWAGFSCGAGLQLERFKVQMAYGRYHVSAGSLLINVTYSL